ncbi:MAG: hypothetical protein HY906_02090, partial [Deltaproteobacteria bacterium]|nr:hypothetical protein [Deltaproteobacteria bacterium]
MERGTLEIGMTLRKGLLLVGATLVSAAVVAACGMAEDEVGRRTWPITAYCTATVTGVGDRDVETDYLPHVVQCENGAADIEALRAQAVAARTFLYYKLETAGHIGDGQGDQVYSCGRTPAADHLQAVADTVGIVLTYHGDVICAFYVAGATQSPPACQGNTGASTETYVTYNDGLSGDSIHQSTLGWVDPANFRNRGCMSQNGAQCLESAGRDWQQILRFYYGADIGIERAVGPCVPVQEDAGAADAPAAADATPAADGGAPTDGSAAGEGGAEGDGG